MRVRSCYFHHVVMSILLIYPHIMSFKAFHLKIEQLWLYLLYWSFHVLHVHALASTCAQNDLDSANLHNMSTNPKKVLPTSDEQFTRSFPDKKVPGRRRRRRKKTRKSAIASNSICRPVLDKTFIFIITKTMLGQPSSRISSFRWKRKTLIGYIPFYF